jgi:hypothetical protein
VTRVVKIGLDSTDLVDALRRHHPAYSGPSGMQWVCLAEWARIDLLAIECWRQARVIGYEVKISRSDMRAELLAPTKRMEAVARTTQFYFATPAGMLTPDEIEFVEPDDWTLDDYVRQPCTNTDCHAKHYINGRGWMKRSAKPRGSLKRGTDAEGVTVDLGQEYDRVVDDHGVTRSHYYQRKACCTVCRGYGRLGQSRVEREAPTLWVPSDCGLVEVSRQGVVEVKRAPTRKTPKPIVGGVAEPDEHRNRVARQSLALLARHASAYQDPRHREHR